MEQPETRTDPAAESRSGCRSRRCSEESVREPRRSMTALPPTYYLHVWWAHRPLVASRAAVLASLLPADAVRRSSCTCWGFMGIRSRPRPRLTRHAGADERCENPYTYDRTFGYTPTPADLEWLSRS